MSEVLYARLKTGEQLILSLFVSCACYSIDGLCMSRQNCSGQILIMIHYSCMGLTRYGVMLVYSYLWAGFPKQFLFGEKLQALLNSWGIMMWERKQNYCKINFAKIISKAFGREVIFFLDLICFSGAPFSIKYFITSCYLQNESTRLQCSFISLIMQSFCPSSLIITLLLTSLFFVFLKDLLELVTFSLSLFGFWKTNLLVVFGNELSQRVYFVNLPINSS